MTRSTRRSLLKMTGVAGTASLAGCVGGLLGGGGQSEVDRLAEEARQSTEKYDGDIQSAIDDGYEAVFGPLVPGQGYHVQNLGYSKEAAEAGEFDITKPQILGFDSDQSLGYVEYGAPDPAIGNQPGLFAEVSEPPEWEVHRAGTHILADESDSVKPIPEWTPDELMTPGRWADLAPPRQDIEPGDEVTVEFGASRQTETRIVDHVTTHPDIRGIHFWVHEENPQGIFAPAHPDWSQP